MHLNMNIMYFYALNNEYSTKNANIYKFFHEKY